MGLRWFFPVISWVYFCVCISHIISAAAEGGTSICDVPGCNCTVKAAKWKIINCSLRDGQIVNSEQTYFPKEAYEINISGGLEINFAPKTFRDAPALALININATRTIVMDKESFYKMNSASLLIQIQNCDELTIKTGAFENVQSSITTELTDINYVTIEEAAFGKLYNCTFKDVKTVTLYEGSFDFKNQVNVKKDVPVTIISFENAGIPEIPRDTFLKSLASVSFVNCQIGDVHTDAFKAAEISAISIINTTIRIIETGAFTDRTLICDLRISKCHISKLGSRSIMAAIINFSLRHSIITDIEPRAIVSTVARAEIVGNQILNFQRSGFIFSSWNQIILDDNIIKHLHANFVETSSHADIEKFSFKGNELYNIDAGALSFLSDLDEKILIFDDNFFNQSCECSDKWLEKMTNNTRKIKLLMDSSFCTVNEFLSRCFSLPVGIINIQNFTEKTCTNFTICQPYEGKTKIINTTSKIFLAEHDTEKQSWLILIIAIVGIFLVAIVATFIFLLIRGSRWLKEKGYFRNMHYNTNDLSNDDENTIVTVDENEKLEIPEELTIEFLQVLSKRLDDPTTHQEASEMIERLYEMFIVDDSYENNNREEEAHLYEELGNLNLQIPPPPYEEENEVAANNGPRSILRLMEEKFNNLHEEADNDHKPALMGDYSEPTDAAVHLYSELREKNETPGEKPSSLKSEGSAINLFRPLPSMPGGSSFVVEAGPSSKT